MSKDAVSVAPDIYEVVFENHRVRVLNVTGKPGSVSQMHYHPDSVIHVLSDATIVVTTQAGEVRQVEIREGETFWTDEGTHSVEVGGDAPVRLIRIELK